MRVAGFGPMEWWSDGVMEWWSDRNLSTPILHYSNTPILHYSTTPLLQHSTTPALHYSSTPLLQHSTTPASTAAPVSRHDRQPRVDRLPHPADARPIHARVGPRILRGAALILIRHRVVGILVTAVRRDGVEEQIVRSEDCRHP